MFARILVINDDQSTLELFRAILEPEGYEVLLSMVMYEDVRNIEHLNPALIILDVMIGNHNLGWALLQQLKGYPPTQDIPLVLCTAALSEVREHEETLRQKGIPVIYKPFDIDELLQVVQKFLPLNPSDLERLTR